MNREHLRQELGLEEVVAANILDLLLKEGVVGTDGMVDKNKLWGEALRRYLGVRGDKRPREEDGNVGGLVEETGRLALGEVGGGEERKEPKAKRGKISKNI